MNIMSRLRHPNIVEYFGIEVHRDKVYIFQEFCEGGTLAALLENGKVEEEVICQMYAHQLLEGLHYLHLNNVVHRDIKPDSEFSSGQSLYFVVFFSEKDLFNK